MDFILRIITTTKEKIINNSNLKINDVFKTLLNAIIPNAPAPSGQTGTQQKQQKDAGNPSNKQPHGATKRIEENKD